MAISPGLVEKQVSRFQDELFDRGLRLTKQREQVFRIVLTAEGHLSAEDLHRKVREENRSIGFATVYRTLRVLVEIGLIEVRQFGDGVQRYESAAGDHHDHMICVACGEVFEFEDDEIERLQIKVAEDRGFEIVSHRLDIYVRNCNSPKCGPLAKRRLNHR
jgi:Fur family ferric uptake transcriptional regulator